MAIAGESGTAMGLSTRALSRRAALRLLVSGTGVALLAACAPISPASQPTSAPAPAPTGASGTAPKPATTSAAAPAPAAGQPRSGGTLRVGLPQDLTTLEGHFVGSGYF